MKQPKAKECRCWLAYPNPMRLEKCKFYECVYQGNKLTRKTVCKLKEQSNERITDKTT